MTGAANPAVELITILEDDPAIGTLTQAPKPNVKKQPFGYQINAPVPPPSTDPTTPAFRYWTAAEALRRGADFWAPAIPSNKWQRGTVLEVNLDRWQVLQANYNRSALNFFHGPSPAGTVYTGASPDVLCHEMGHAILDAIKPELWNAGLHEVAAFHECFGDISSILSSLQLASFRTSILMETGGQILSNSRLSRVAEQFGVALHAEDPGAADADCLRNAINSFSYRDPQTLPSTAPSSQLSSKPHSFSRIFTGAWFEALAGMLDIHAADKDAPSPDELHEITFHMRDIIAESVRQASVVPNYFAEVASKIVAQSRTVNPAYAAVFTEAFLRRSIFSLETAAVVKSGGAIPAGGGPVTATFAVAASDTAALPQTALLSIPSAKYGLDEPLHVETASHLPSFIARSAMTNGKPMELLSPDTAAMSFVDELFANSDVQVDEPDEGATPARTQSGIRTHRIVRGETGLYLERIMFSCGHCNEANSRSLERHAK